MLLDLEDRTDCALGSIYRCSDLLKPVLKCVGAAIVDPKTDYEAFFLSFSSSAGGPLGKRKD